MFHHLLSAMAVLVPVLISETGGVIFGAPSRLVSSSSESSDPVLLRVQELSRLLNSWTGSTTTDVSSDLRIDGKKIVAHVQELSRVLADPQFLEHDHSRLVQKVLRAFLEDQHDTSSDGEDHQNTSSDGEDHHDTSSDGEDHHDTSSDGEGLTLFRALLKRLPSLDFEHRKDATNLLRQVIQIADELVPGVVVQYVRTTKIVGDIVSFHRSCDRSDMRGFYDDILRGFFQNRSPALVQAVLEAPPGTASGAATRGVVFELFETAKSWNDWEIALSAEALLLGDPKQDERSLLQHKNVSASFVQENFEDFFAEFHAAMSAPPADGTVVPTAEGTAGEFPADGTADGTADEFPADGTVLPTAEGDGTADELPADGTADELPADGKPSAARRHGVVPTGHAYVRLKVFQTLLSRLLLDPAFMQVMLRYVASHENLKLHMNLLREKGKSIPLGAFHVFKIFVANPDKTEKVQEILWRNRERLVKLLEGEGFAGGRWRDREEEDPAYQDMKTVCQKLRDMERPVSMSRSF